MGDTNSGRYNWLCLAGDLEEEYRCRCRDVAVGEVRYEGDTAEEYGGLSMFLALALAYNAWAVVGGGGSLGGISAGAELIPSSKPSAPLRNVAAHAVLAFSSWGLSANVLRFFFLDCNCDMFCLTKGSEWDGMARQMYLCSRTELLRR